MKQQQGTKIKRLDWKIWKMRWGKRKSRGGTIRGLGGGRKMLTRERVRRTGMCLGRRGRRLAGFLLSRVGRRHEQPERPGLPCWHDLLTTKECYNGKSGHYQSSGAFNISLMLGLMWCRSLKLWQTVVYLLSRIFYFQLLDSRASYANHITLGLLSLNFMSSKSNEEWQTSQATAHEHGQEGYIHTDYFQRCSDDIPTK
jgi:hypothetical protein